MGSNEEYIRKNKVVIVDDDKNTKLHYAAALGNLDEIKKFIARGQKLDPENYLGWTPLMMAVRNAKRQSLELLLEYGADATKKNKFGINVFMISVTSGDLQIVELILNHLLRGGVSRRNLQQVLSPISLAILFGQSHIFKYLLERSFDPDAATPLTRITPMMFAAAIGNHKAVKKLLHYKADGSLRNVLGKTAQDIFQSKHQRIDIDTVGCRKKSPQLPVIIVNSCTSNSPHLQLTPYPIEIGAEHIRKSSNVATPNLCTPAISPITPQMYPQMFFGPDFSPGQFVSPVPAYPSNHFLNTAVTPSSGFFSPMPAQPMMHHYV